VATGELSSLQSRKLAREERGEVDLGLPGCMLLVLALEAQRRERSCETVEGETLREEERLLAGELGRSDTREAASFTSSASPGEPGGKEGNGPSGWEEAARELMSELLSASCVRALRDRSTSPTAGGSRSPASSRANGSATGVSATTIAQRVTSAARIHISKQPQSPTHSLYSR
jgi:hypothetical protein